MKTKVWQFLVVMAGFLLISACGGGGGSSSHDSPLPDPQDQIPTGLVKTVPADRAFNVDVDTFISAEFELEINPDSATEGAFFVNDLNFNEIKGVEVVDGNTITIIPGNSLNPDTVYEATVTTDLEDMTGAALLEVDYTWSFTTKDTIPPVVTSFSPVGEDVAINSIVAVTFSEQIDPASVNDGSLTLRDALNGAVQGDFFHNDFSVIFIPSGLSAATDYRAELSESVTDLAGNPVEGFSWYFTTGNNSDLTAPEVIDFGPSDGATGVYTGETIWATFSETINPYTVNNGTFDVRDGSGAKVAGVLTTNGATVTFTPTSGLGYKEDYTVFLAGIEDMAQNSMAPHGWSFTTGMGVVSVTPSPSRNNVAINQPIYVVFSEPVDPATVNHSTFSLVDDKSISIPGKLQVDGAKVTFTPDGNFIFKTIYTATLSTEIAALEDGEQLPQEYSWKFRAGKKPLRVPKN